MYRTPTHEPRYKQRTRDREWKGTARRYEESSEGSSSDEDEESTDRFTEETEDTTESHYNREDCQWNAAASSSFDRDKIFARFNRPEDFLMRAYYANERVQKHDKITQKNFLSPFPSFLIPPIYREGVGQPNHRFATVRTPAEDQDDKVNSGKPPRGSPKKSDGYEEENTCTRHAHRERKLCDKHKAQREMRFFSSKWRPERILTCMQGETSVDPASILSRNAFEAEGLSRNSPKTESGKKPKCGGDKATEPPGKCKECLRGVESRKRVRRSGQVGAKQTEKAVKEAASGKKSPEGTPGSPGSGKVRERLVYVVEEEGKDTTKLETDLFSVNEILTIKKDLLELSEFAKKLKKLKEMKRKAEKGKASKSACQCKPVAELLKNVNKRIEALEARQEELERGSHKVSQKGDTETESKKTTDPKTSSDSPPKTPVVRKQSAMTTVPSFPKTEMIVSRAGFSNNSEIVNELMDIKTQLQKLEKRRMSKELTPEAAPLGESNITKKKDHAIAVFSSRTYILTAEKYEKTKEALPMKAEGKVKGYFPEHPRSRTEQTKENVANWLKSVSPIGERSENEIAMFMEAEKLQQEINAGQPDSFHCGHVFSGDGFESQEPQKNRAPEVQPMKRDGTDWEGPEKNATKTRVYQLMCKECVMTPSGRVFVKKSSEGLASGQKGLPTSRGVRRSASSCSVPSRVLAKGRAGRPKKVFRDSPKLAASHSKSTQGLSGSSHGREDQKTVRNVKGKDLTWSPPREKDQKESKNELVKRRDSNLIALKDFGRGDDPLSSSSLSELIRTINLETDKPSDSIDRHEESGGNDMHIYSLATMTKLNFKGFDIRGKDDVARERARERRRKEEEAEREAARKEIQKPGYSRRNEQCFSRAANVGMKERSQKVEQEVCECACCCKKKLKEPLGEGRGSVTETYSTVDSRVTPEVQGSRESLRRKRKGSNERVNFKKDKDWERKRRERRNEMMKESRSRERRKERMKESRSRERRKERMKESRSRERRKEKMKESRSKEKRKEGMKESRSRERKKERMNKSRSRENARKKRSKEREKKKESKDCLKKSKKSKEAPKKPEKTPSKDRISCSHNRLSCKCQEQWESSSCETESVPSRSCSREMEQPSELIKSTVPTRPKVPSEDSIDVYLRRQRRRAQLEKEKLVDDSCIFRNIFKNIRKLYPKFSNFQLGNFSGDCSERKPLRQQHQQPQKRPMEECLEDRTTEEEDDCEGYNERALRQSSSLSLVDRQHQHHYHGYHNASAPHHHHEDARHQHATRSGHLENCKCVRVFLQTQGGQNWPGALPFRSLSDEGENEISSKCSIESRNTIKSDFIFPGRLPENQCVGHSTERRRRSKAHRRRGRGANDCCRRCRHNRRKHRGKVCVCDKCGNVHRKKKAKKKREHRPKESNCCECGEKEPLEEMNKPSEHLHFPLLSFLKHFCKNKYHCPRKGESKSGLMARVSKTSLNACEKIKKNIKKQTQNKYCATNASESCFPFAPKLIEIEDRLKILEQICAGDEHSKKKKKRRSRYDNEVEFCDGKRERRRKRRREVKECVCCINLNKETPKEEPEKKNKTRERKESCDCCPNGSSVQEQPNEVQTYYCACPASVKTIETTNTIETNESLTTKATTTTTTTATTATTGDTVSSSPLKNKGRSSKRDWRLSSLQSLLNNFHMHRRAKPQANNSTNIFVIKEPGFIEDCGKSSRMPRRRFIHELKAGPSGFMKKIKKLKTKTRKKDKKGGKEKAKAAKGKSMS